jgi:type IV pilus assembly protein PilP
MRRLLLPPCLFLSCWLATSLASANDVVLSTSVHDIDAASLLRITSDLLGEKVVADPRLNAVRVDVSADCRGWNDLLALVAKSAGSKLSWVSGLPVIDESSRPLGRPAPQFFDAQRNNCPYRYSNFEESARAVLPNKLRACEPLEFYDRDSLTVKGFISTGNEYVALVESPDGFVWSVQKDDYMGKDYGQVFAISRLGIDVREIVQDNNEQWQLMSTVLPFPGPNPSIERTHNGGTQWRAPSWSATPLCAAHVKR